MDHHLFLHRLAQESDRKIVLLVVDGVGDLVTGAQPETPLDRAATPHLDALAARAALGRIVPVAPGVTPGSGPGHLALFGYDPASPDADIGRGVLEALGVGMEVRRGDVLARGNFATAGGAGELTDRRAGRPSNEENRRLVAAMQAALDDEDFGATKVELESGEGHRFVLRLRGEGLSPKVADTDPQKTGAAPLAAAAEDSEAEDTAALVRRAVAAMEGALTDEPKANRALLRGFSSLPHLPPMPELYRLRCGAFAGYPLYRGVAQVCGMEVVECGKNAADVADCVARHWSDFDYFFLHLKQADMAGEDGDFDAKVRAIEAADAVVPRLLELGPAVVAVTGDHSTPAPLAGHSWHPVPLLLWSDRCFVDEARRFTETEATRGHLGTLPSMHLMGLLLANAGRLAKYGA
jgi:2,3-bisphosphoglycerate-independent phosphoglycerate mutase